MRRYSARCGCRPARDRLRQNIRFLACGITPAWASFRYGNGQKSRTTVRIRFTARSGSTGRPISRRRSTLRQLAINRFVCKSISCRMEVRFPSITPQYHRDKAAPEAATGRLPFIHSFPSAPCVASGARVPENTYDFERTNNGDGAKHATLAEWRASFDHKRGSQWSRGVSGKAV